MIYAIITVIVSLLSLLSLRQLAFKINWLDRPDVRKAHANPVPAVGGLAWLLGFASVILVFRLAPDFHGLMAGIILLAAVGAYDDVRPLSSSIRFVAQAVAVLIAIYPNGVVLLNLGDLFWPDLMINLPAWMAWPLTVFAIIGVINALNMIDGMDGALVSISLVTLLVLVAVFHHAGDNVPALLAGLAIAGLLPFMLLNVRTPWMRRAKVFFGDAGSTAIGLLIGYLLVLGSQVHSNSAGIQWHAVFKPVFALYALALPLVDTVSLMLRRMAHGKSPFTPDQEHLHHLLQRAGFSVSQSLLIMLMCAAVLAIAGVLLQQFNIPTVVATLGFLCGAITYHFGVIRVLRNRHFFGRPLTDSVSSGA